MTNKALVQPVTANSDGVTQEARPKKRARRAAVSAAHIAMFVGLMVVGGRLSVPIPFGAVSLTFQTLFVMASGLFLGARDGAAVQLIYLLMGLLGLPVFTMGSGISYVFQPSFGYLIAFPLSAFLTGILFKRVKKISVLAVFVCALIGLVVTNIIGASYQFMILTVYLKNPLTVLPIQIVSVLTYFVKDAVLLLLLSVVFPRLSKVVRIR